MDRDYNYIVDLKHGEFLDDGSLVHIIGENMTGDRHLIMYGPKMGVIAYGTFLSGVGLFIDAFLILVLVKLVSNEKGTNRFFLGSLLFLQMVMLTLVVPMEIAREYLGKWVLGDVTCYLWTLLGHACVPAMLWLCVAIIVDRINVLRRRDVYPTRNKGYKTPCLIIAVSVFTTLSVAPLICWMATREIVLVEVCAIMVDKLYTTVLTTLCYFIPACVCIVANVILAVLTARKIHRIRFEDYRDSQTALDPKTRYAPFHRKNRLSQSMEAHIDNIKNTRLSVILITLSLIILWAPFYVINIKIPFCDGFCVDPRLWTLLQWIGYSSCIATPCLYLFDNRIAYTIKLWLKLARPETEHIYTSASEYSSRSGC